MVVARSGADVNADVSTDEGRQRVIEAVRHGGRLDVLVNNVGTNIRKPTAEFTSDDFRRLFDINLASAWELTRALLPMLRESKGSIVNVSSVSAVTVATMSTSLYAMTKAAMDHMTRFLAVEEGKHGVRINSVQPWYIKTPLTAGVLADEEKLKRILSSTPMARLGEPEDVARAIAFLAMPASGWMTGVSMPVDGGFLALGI